jgi:hypothetical protein
MSEEILDEYDALIESEVRRYFSSAIISSPEMVTSSPIGEWCT